MENMEHGGTSTSTQEEYASAEEGEAAQVPSLMRQAEGMQWALGEADWREIEDGLRTTSFQIAFSMDKQRVAVGETVVGIRELQPMIIKYCAENGVEFEGGTLAFVRTTNQQRLVGRPVCPDRSVWKLLQPGYLVVLGVTVWVQPSFTGKRTTNLSMVELEYQNINQLTLCELRGILRKWGAKDAIIVSHAQNLGKPAKWAATDCLSKRSRLIPEPMFGFRLFFYSEYVANSVFKTYRDLREHTHELLTAAEQSAELKPVGGCVWDPRQATLARLTYEEQKKRQARRLMAVGLSEEVSREMLVKSLNEAGFPGATVEIRGPRRNSAMIELSTPREAAKCLSDVQTKPLVVGQITISLRPHRAPGQLVCYKCHQPGHIRANCQVAAPPATDRGQPRVWASTATEAPIKHAALTAGMLEIPRGEMECRLDTLKAELTRVVEEYQEKMRHVEQKMAERERQMETSLQQSATLIQSLQADVVGLARQTNDSVMAAMEAQSLISAEWEEDRRQNAATADTIAMLCAYLTTQQLSRESCVEQTAVCRSVRMCG